MLFRLLKERAEIILYHRTRIFIGIIALKNMILIRFTAVWISHVIPIEQRIEIKLNVMQKCNFALHSASEINTIICKCPLCLLLRHI